MRRYRYLLPLILCALIRVGWLAWSPVNPIAPVDAEGFHLLAVNVRAGRGFSIGWSPPFCPTSVRTPLYPVFLLATYAGLGADPIRAARGQVLLEVVTTALVIALGRSLADRIDRDTSLAPRVGFWAGMGYAFSGTATRYVGLLLSESLLVPLLAWALWMTVRYLHRPGLKWAALSGLAWGLAVLTKPNVQYLAAGSLLLMTGRALWDWPGLWRQLGAGVGLFAVVLLPWMWRNHRAFDRWMLSTAFEENLVRVSAVATLAETRGVRAEPWSETWEYLYAQFAERETGRAPSDAQGLPCRAWARWHRQLAEAARTLVWTHAGSYLRVHLRGVLDHLLDPGHRVWYARITGRSWEETGVVPDIWDRLAWSLARGAVGDAIRAFVSERVREIPPIAAWVWWILAGIRAGVSALSLRGGWRLRSDPWVLLLGIGAMGYLLLLPGPIAHDRFLLPALPTVLSLASVGLVPLEPRG